MDNARFMRLISSLGDLGHHQRKRLSATVNQVGDEAKVFGLIEEGFEANSACPHCASAELHRNGCAGGLKRYRCLKPKLSADALLASNAEGFSHETVNLSQGQLINGAYPVQNVNAYQSRLKQWLARFHGVATHYLPNSWVGGGLLSSTAKSNRKHC